MALTTEKKPLDSLYKAVSSQIKINGQLLDSNFEINKIITFKEINKLSRARIQILGGDYTKNTFNESENKIFDPGNEVEIKFGYDQKLTVIFEGIILKHSISIKEGFIKKKSKSLLLIDCVDKAVMLKNSFTTKVFREKTDDQIINSLINNIPGLSCEIDSTNYQHSVLPKYNIDDWNFILQRSKLNGLLVLNSNNKVVIKDPSVSNISPKVTVNNGTGTINFEAHLDSNNQFNSITLGSQDTYNDETFLKVGTNQNGVVTNELNSAKEISKKSSPDDLEINIPYDVDSNELKVLADSLTKISRLQRISGSVKFKGVLDIDLDTVIALSGFGNRFDGNVYVSHVSHEIEEGKIFTEVEFGLREDFFNQNVIFDKKNLTNNISGLYIGQVIQIDNDPENQNRIKVQIPALNDVGDGIWAKLTHFYTGENNGIFFIPETGTQVVISFIANDSRNPVILGCLYTNLKKPYESINENNNLKCFMTKSNLKIEFKEDEKEISISTPSGNKIFLNEENKEISIQDQNNNSIKTSSSGIDIQSGKNINISSGGTIKISAKGKFNISSNADVDIKGLNISQKADAKLSANATSNLEFNSSGIAVLKGSIVQIN
tara:strand:- start:13839 stop:15653 length:1815 start_codon:yes stop_codon:yes gene_type:complete